MSINLHEIRAAVISYMDNKVTVLISAFTPATGATINPNEEFSFTLTAQNADAASGGIALKNVVWRVWVENDAVAKLIVPSAPMVARSSLSATSALTPGSLVKEMYLFPPNFLFPPLSKTVTPIEVGTDIFPLPIDSAKSLGVGDTDTLSLKGKAGATPAGGATNIRFKVYADVDLDWLFPPSQDSATATRGLPVSG